MELAPVIPPIIVPIVHVKLLGVLEVNVIFVLVPLHIDNAALFVTTGVGLTVTVMVNGNPTHKPVVEVGMTIYSTDPAVDLLGLVNI